MAITSFSTLSDDAVTYIRDELLSIAEVNVVFGQHALMADLPQHNSKTCQFSRYPRLALPMTPVAVEGTTPSQQSALAVETVQAVVDQWILIVGLTDIAQLTVKHPLIPIVTERLGLVQAELVDREIQKVLLASPSVSFSQAGGAATVRTALTTTSILDSTAIRTAWSVLSRNGARPMGTNYVLIVDPEVSQDISAASGFLSAHQFQDVKAIYNNTIGSYLGFDVEVSNFIPKVLLGVATSWTVATATSTAGGIASWTNAADLTSVEFRLEAINNSTGLVEKVFAHKGTSMTSTVGTTAVVKVTIPSTSGFLYNLFMATADNTSAVGSMQVVASAQDPSTVIYFNAFPTADSSLDKPQTEGFSTTVGVHTSYCLAREAFGMVKLSGDNLRVYMTDGKATDSDPAGQRRKISLKGSFKAVVLQDDYLRRIESGSAF